MHDGNTIPFTHDMIGRRIAHARKLRGLTQRELADRAKCSKSLIAQVEGGHKPATPALIGAVARALHIEVTELTGQPYRGSTANTDRVHEAIPQIRQALAHWDIPPELDVPPRPLPQLATAVQDVTRLRHAARYVELGARLPALIDELSVYAHTATDQDRPRVFGLLAETYIAADSMAYKLGYMDLFSIAVERAIWAARQSDDPLLPVVADYRRSMAFLATGAYGSGSRLVERNLRQLEPEMSDERPFLSVYGSLHLRQAILAARGNRASTAWEHIDAARETAKRAGGDTPDYGLSFGPSNAEIHATAVAVELGDADEAVRRGANLVLPATVTPERMSHHYIDLSRAWLWQGWWDKALACVLTAERIAPQMTRYHPMSRETVARLLDIQRRLPSPLRGLARRMGIAR